MGTCGSQWKRTKRVPNAEARSFDFGFATTICKMNFPPQVWLIETASMEGSLQKRVANLWTEFAAHEGEALIANGKELQNPNKLVVAATCEVAKS